MMMCFRISVLQREQLLKLCEVILSLPYSLIALFQDQDRVQFIPYMCH